MATNEQILAEIEDLLRTMPNKATIRHETDENHSWIGRACSLIEAWNPAKFIIMQIAITKFREPLGRDAQVGFQQLLDLVQQARHDLRLKTIGPLSVSLSQGGVFNYFDEIRKIIETASDEVFFVDPYLDAEFISRYLPHVKSGVSIRLLTTDKKKNSLIPAAQLFSAQFNRPISVRFSGTGLHDRYIFIDRQNCYQSGASFKDGARQAPTTLTQITDAFSVVLSTYEEKWLSGIVS